jgi:hypothetical protein
MPSTEWHWEQGAKLALEGIKTSLLLNGAAAVALVTFANTLAVCCFALGAMVSAFAFLPAYLAQLEYGNAEVPGVKDKQRIWKRAQRYNIIGLAIVLLSMLIFLVGTVWAAFDLLSNSAADTAGANATIANAHLV